MKKNLIIIFLLTLTCSAISLFVDKKNVLATKVTSNKNYLDVSFDKLKEINKDVVGWIIIKNTNINYPILKTTDNIYYKDHNYKRDFDLAGSIYQDYQEESLKENITLYGHNLYKNMFADLRTIVNGELGTDIYIKVLTETKEMTYKVFKTYLNNNEKNQFEIDVTDQDHILTLKTISLENTNEYLVKAIKIEEKSL